MSNTNKKIKIIGFLSILFLFLFLSFSNSTAETLLKQVIKTHTDDLSGMTKRKKIRALVTYSRTDFFFSDNGTPKGLQVDLLNEYEKQLNANIKKESEKIRIQYIPTTFDRLIPDLLEGKGDIIASLMTITPQREQKIDFVSGRMANVKELLVTHKSINDINSVEDLAGKEIYVLKGSSYVEHLKELNKLLLSKQLAAIKITEADSHLKTEDIFELVNTGVVKLTVADGYKARIWAKVLPDIKVVDAVAIKSGTHIGWAIRKNSLELKKSLNKLIKKVKKGTYLGNLFFNRYYKKDRWIKNANTAKERNKLLEFMDLFKKYGDKYGFDALAIAAQGYQESQLDQKKKSHRGAMGIMQLLPSTAADKNVDIADISSVENNIHAGVKYMAFLRDRYFSDAQISSEDQMAFSWAAYNAGPAKVRKMRAKAKQMGLNPNIWYSNVEVAAAKMVGRETVEYVSNIFKYYIAYSLAQQYMSKATK